MGKTLLHERFLNALDAAAPDTRYDKVCGDIGFGADLVDTWRQTTPGFRDRFEGLVVDGRRAPIPDEVLVDRLHLYVKELGLGFTDDGVIDRAAAARRAGVRLADVVRYTDKGSGAFSEAFHALEEEILLQQTVRVEDAAATLAPKSAEEAKKDGWDFRQLSGLTSYLKTRSVRHQDQSRVVVEGEVKHRHQIEQGVNVMRELSSVSARLLPPAPAKPKLVKAS